jgi:FkbM family methyltransferase
MEDINVQFRWYRSLPIGLAFRLTMMFIARKLLRIPASLSFSQGAEDILLRVIMNNQLKVIEPGNYVDVGCNLPVTDSNTFDLYLRGWRGLNIDANGEMIRVCKRMRKEDVSIVAAVSDSEREVVFHKSDTHLVSTIDEDRLLEWKKLWEYKVEDEEIVTTRTLTSILDEYWTEGRPVDLLSIDVEGQDFQVLKGLDFDRYRPKIIVIETWEFDRIYETDIFIFLTEKGYRLRHLAYINAFFTDETQNSASA